MREESVGLPGNRYIILITFFFQAIFWPLFHFSEREWSACLFYPDNSVTIPFLFYTLAEIFASIK